LASATLAAEPGTVEPTSVLVRKPGPDADGRRLSGAAAVHAAAVEAFKAMPDAQWAGPKHFIAGNRGVTQWTFTATRPDGSKVVSVGCDVFEFRDGLIAVKDSYRKAAGLPDPPDGAALCFAANDG
jgi:hypothetical protein